MIEGPHIVSIDIDYKTLNYSKIILRDFIKKDRVIFLKQDVLRFLKSCKDSSFDVFTSVFTLHNFSEKYRDKVIKEIYRVLKNKGFFVNGDKYAIDNNIKQKRDFNWQLTQFKIFDEKGRPNLKDKWTKHYLKDEKRGS